GRFLSVSRGKTGEINFESLGQPRRACLRYLSAHSSWDDRRPQGLKFSFGASYTLKQLIRNRGTARSVKREINLKEEHDAVRRCNEAVKICVAARDKGSKTLFYRMVQDERPAHFSEAQLHSIKQMGIANYLSQPL